ncbi:MAG: FAD-dependent oxidoreductase [Planctomycetota bacterium]
MVGDFDLLVLGAGPAGAAAAIAAARGGARTLLVERLGFAGGMATAGLVNPFLGTYYRNPETGRDGELIAGVYAEICDRLRGRGALLRFRYDGPDSVFSDAFDDVRLRVVYDELLTEAGVEVLFHARLLDAEVSGGRVESVRLVGKEGVLELGAGSFIDSTGDADLVAAAGGECEVGRAEDGLCQPCSTMFRMGGVNKEMLLADGLRAARGRVNTRFREARDAGRLDFAYKSGLGIYEFPRAGVLHFNATRVLGKPALTSGELSRVETEGRRQAALLADWLHSEVPCFERSFLESVASHVGVRETRRVRGRCVMTREDVVGGARFGDGVARSAYFIDIHDPAGPGGLHAHEEVGGKIRDGFKPERYYEIPFGSLVPEGLGNLLVACRAISTDHYAHAATRVMATMTAVGEAAGRAAAIAKRKGLEVGEVDGAEVRGEVGYLDGPLGF